MAVIGLGLLLTMFGLTANPAAADRPGEATDDHQIEICHGTSAQEQNPFTTPTPFKWQIMAPNGHDTHNGDDSSYPDIIPPFAAGSKGNHSWDAYPGKNWTSEVVEGRTGQEIWEAGCNIVEPTPGSITLDKVTAGDGQPAGTTAFDFTVVCDTEEGTVTAAPTITPEDQAVEVASGLLEGDECTITETGTAGAASTSTAVDDGADVSGASVTVAITGEGQARSVVFTNTYACPAGQLPDGQGGCATDVCPDVADLQTDPAACPAPVDACPDPGFQATVAECPSVVLSNVTPEVTVTPAVQVAGVQVVPAAQELPRTGNTTLPLIEIGVGLMLMGAGALLVGKGQTSAI